MSYSPGDKIGPYKILSMLGKGGMGEVYLAQDPRLQRQVAIKILPRERLEDPERRKRFLREARAAAAVDHPNIVHIHDVQEQDDGLIYLVMQHVEGRTLREVLVNEKLPLDRTLAIAIEVSGALSAAHEKGIVHRDIKPDNIMLDSSGHARLVDFGLARALEPVGPQGDVSSLETMTRVTSEPGKVMGTAAYMSPEQARGKEVDARSDIFSLGVTLYEMVTRRHPFAGRTSVDTVDSLLNKDPRPIGEHVGGLPPEIDWVLSKMLSKEREERHQSARELEADLRKLGRGSSTSGASSAAGVHPEGSGKGKLVLGVIAVLAVAAITILWMARNKLGPLPPEMVALSTGQTVAPAASIAPIKPAMQMAVLPFQNVRNDDRIDFLGFALADGLISKLSMTDDVTVRPSSFIQKYRDSPPSDPKLVGEELGVSHLLTGSLIAQGDDLRVSVQFVDLEKGELQWQDTVDTRLDNLLKVQDAVVALIVDGLKLRISDVEQNRLDRDRPQNKEAFALFLRAAALPQTLQGNQEAKDLLRRAVALDDQFAPAWAHLSQRIYRVALSGELDPNDYIEGEKTIQKALELNPDLPSAIAGLATLYTETNRHEEIYPRLKAWIDRNPHAGLGHFAMSYLMRYAGMVDEAARYAEQALLLEPGNPALRSGAAVLAQKGDLDRAWDFVNLDVGSGFYYAMAPSLAFMEGDMARALALNAEALEYQKTAGSPRLQDFVRAVGLTLRGEKATAREYFSRWTENAFPDPETQYTYGAMYALAGGGETAIREIGEAVRSGYYPYSFMLTDPRTESIRTDPAYLEVLALAKKRHESFKAFVAANP